MNAHRGTGLLLSVLSVLLLVGCSSGGGGGPSPGDDATSEADGAARDSGAVREDVRRDAAAPDVPQGPVELPPCVSDEDCGQREHCLPGYSGDACLPECLAQDDCPRGYFCRALTVTEDALTFVCQPDLPPLCLPCAGDERCGNHGRCVEVDGQPRCASFCTMAEGCPAGYACEDVGSAQPDAPAVGLCRPASGSCECSPRTAGQRRACFREGPEGACPGFETCDPLTGWGGCDAPEPAAEDCDGRDNDCDGAIDEGLPEAIACEQTTDGVGTCTGRAVCAGQLGWVCDAPVPALESCDYRDDDCDGETDEDFLADGQYGVDEHCGACNVTCAGAVRNGTAFCDVSGLTPACAVASCDEGFYPAGRFQCLPADVEHCRPCAGAAQCGGGVCLDGGSGARFCTTPCDGDEQCPDTYACVEKLDDSGAPLGSFCLPANGTCDCGEANVGAERACARTNEFGTCFGAEVCDPAQGWVGCSAAAPEAEVCDGVDNDCDGVPDDGLPVDDRCAVEVPGVGSCPGRNLCFGSRGWSCVAPAPGPETCDHWDNDCDGETDEGFTVDGAYLLPAHCGACGVDCGRRIPNATTACQPGVDGAPTCVVLACAPGFYQVAPDRCARVSTVLCTPCADDGGCGGGQCVTAADGRGFCSRACDAGGACPVGYTCADAGGGLGALCLPESGDCLCTRAEAGLVRPCFVSGAAGTCFGRETCDPALGWTGCTAATPAAEVCNGVDDDCDGAVDETDGAPPAACEVTNEHGTCVGIERCVGGAPVCTAATPAADVCNYLDDDCDGVVDQAFQVDGVYLLDSDCGGCGNDCAGAIPNATAACAPVAGGAACTVVACDPGYVRLNAFTCVEQPAILCVACAGDDDCLGGVCHDAGAGGFCATDCAAAACPSGYTCQEVGGGASLCLPASGTCDCDASKDGTRKWCQVTNEHGACNGYAVCAAASGWGPCVARTPAPETCDGQDENCDGRIDEGLLLPAPCAQTNEWGACAGTARCLGAAGVVCDAPAPAPEACNLADDDCDGVTDEDFLTDGRYLGTANCGACGNDCAGTIPGAVAVCGLSPVGTPACRVGACEDGYVPVGDGACIPPPDTVCRPCDADAECYGAACTNLDGELFCLTRCESSLDCPGGTQCQDVAGTEGRRCLPLSGTCSCTADNDGAARVCSYATAAGTCYGFETCAAGAGWSECDARVPGDEVCNGLDDDCDGAVDEGLPETRPCTTDNAWGSCPGTAVCVGALGWLCDAPAASPEVCDGLDNDCDGAVDEPGAAGCTWLYEDADGDGYGSEATAACLCAPEGAWTQVVGGDCDDTTAAVSPAARESCAPPGVDDDCDGQTDEEGAAGCRPHYRDGDGDGWAVPGPSRCLCAPTGEWSAVGLGDCDDADGARSPGTPEICDGPPPAAGEADLRIDNDCDGLTDEDGAVGCTPYYRDGDGDGFGRTDDVRCACAPRAPWTLLVGGDCNDQLAGVHPGAPEVCNGFDDDCDGETDEDATDCLTFYRDEDGDGFGVTGDTRCRCLAEPPYTAVAGGDCDDDDPDVSPVAPERCNGPGEPVDDDCDGTTDGAFDLPGCTLWYADGDGDGYGRDDSAVCACAATAGHPVAAGGDCDDADGTIHPGAADICDGVDQNCDGETDEGAGDLDGDGVADCIDPCPILVDAAAAAGGDGSVAAPFRTVQEGIDAADEVCAEVWVRPGAYEERIVFGGRDAMVRSTDGPEVTILDGGEGGSVVTFVDGETAAAGLDGFTVTGGSGTSGAAFDGGDPGRTYGGGVFVSGAAPTITDCVIEGNSVTGMGGGVFFHASAGRLLGGAVRDNFATGSGEGGAGVALFESTAAVHEVVIRGNTASGAGGGLLLRRSGGSIRYNFIVDNAAAEGAGLRQSGYGAAIVDGNVIADNLGEGVSFFEYSATKFIGNTVVGNTGHGVRLTLCCGPLFAVPLLRNDIIAYNDGRGIFTDYNVDFGLFFTEIWSNTAGNYGGVMGSLANTNLGVTSRNCLFRAFSDNRNPDDDDLRLGAGSPCIDSGGDVTLYFVTRDWDGNPRPVAATGTAARYDRGAFEAQP
jgi:hypothetical protein